MPSPWLQIKGDPSVRAFLFQQTRQASLFDEHIDQLHRLIHDLIVTRGAFHIKAHYSSSQLTCWFYDDPYNYRVFVRDELFTSAFLNDLPNATFGGRKPTVGTERLDLVLDEFKRLRLADQQLYLRSASINCLSGMIGMNFSCDGTHYIEHEEFFERLYAFATV